MSPRDSWDEPWRRPGQRPTPPGRGRSSRLILVVCLLGLTFALVSGGVWLWRQQSPPTLDEPAAQRLEQALGSGDETRVSSAIALPDAQDIDPAFVATLASMHPDIDRTTFSPQGDSTATVAARAGQEEWILVLRRGGPLGWQLLSTFPAR